MIRAAVITDRCLSLVGGGLDASGNLVAWQHRIVCQSFIVGTPVEPRSSRDGVDDTAVEGAAETPLRHSQSAGGLEESSRRRAHLVVAVGGTFAYRLRHRDLRRRTRARGGQDPCEYRRALLGNRHPRLSGVLELVAEKAGWGKPLPGRTRPRSGPARIVRQLRRAGRGSLGLQGRQSSECIASSVRWTAAHGESRQHPRADGRRHVAFGLTCALTARSPSRTGA